MEFKVNVEDKFEGPLDLMLHLIKENKLDLFDLDMSLLCDQYLAYLNAMQSMHLEVASEFLSELAGLIEYKSKKLLPKEEVVVEEVYEEDQRERLVQRLLEYQKFKQVSEAFQVKYEERQKLMSKPQSDETNKWTQIVHENEFAGNPYDLIKAMNRVIRRISLETIPETTMQVNELSLDERLKQIKLKIEDMETKLSFEDLCNDCDSLHMVIVTFLSILDLIKRGVLNFYIDDQDVIWMNKGGSDFA